MNNSNQSFDPNNINELLGTASQKIGTSPEALQKQINEGKLDDIMKKLPKNQQQNLKNIISNPEMAKKMMETPQAKMLMKRFFNQK